MYLNILSDILKDNYIVAIMAATIGMAGFILGQVLAGKSLRKIKVSQYLFGFVLLGYLFLLGTATGLLISFDFSLEIFRLRSVNLIPLDGFTTEQGIMNVALFLPLGFLVPFVFHGMKKSGWGKVLMASFGISLMVEVLQLFHETRAFDVNDLMFNTLGGLAGYGIYRLLKLIFKRL